MISKRMGLMLLRAVRFGLGAVSWFAPQTTSRLMLLDPPSGTSERYLMRLFGVRDTLMGVDLLVGDDDQLRHNLIIGIGVDLVDVTASVVSGMNGRARPLGVVYRCFAALVGASLGAAALGTGPLAIRPQSEPESTQ
jgi:hypothetical protein